MADVRKKREGKYSKQDKEQSGKRDKERSSKHDKERSSKHGKKSPTVELYCAIYEPQFGNYYHWAFSMNDPQTRRWHLSQVLQEEEDGEYIRSQLAVNPNDSSRCRQPLLWLGRMPASHWEWLITEISYLQVPGDALSWTCQDHVMEIWDLLRSWDVIDKATYDHGYQAMLPYYGPDFGGHSGEEYAGEEYAEEYEGEEYEGEEYEGETEGRILSEEFVYDSDDLD